MPANGAITVGVCGVGAMGSAAAQALVASGHEVLCYDRSATALSLMAAQGIRTTESLDEIGRVAQVVILFLPDAEPIREVLQGSGGLFSNHPTVIVDMSTVSPLFTAEMYQVAERLGVGYLDAPVLGRPQSVGKWVLPVGGRPDTLDLVRPILSVLAARIVHAGDSGAGNTVKLLNQMMFGAINAITAEVLALASRLNVSHELFVDTIGTSSAATVSGLFREIGARVVADMYDEPTFSIDLLAKDVRLGLEMARGVGANPIVAGAVDVLTETTRHLGFGRQDTSATWKAVHDMWEETPPKTHSITP